MTLILASASPRRRELLARVGIELEVKPAATDETAHPGETAIAYAIRVAAAKADTVVGTDPARWVLAADTVVEIDGLILGKADNAGDAASMLGGLVGRSHRVTTAFAVRGPGGYAVDRSVTTEVTMRSCERSEIDDYIASGEWRGKAGAYAVQGIAAALVSGVRGSITNVIGLPLAEVIEELRRAGAPVPDYRRGEPS